MVARTKETEMARSNAGGGHGSKNIRARNAPKIEPRSRAMSPAAVNQLGGHVGDHTMRGPTNYRGEELVRGKGYSGPIGPTDNVAAVGVGGGRTIYKSGTQSGLQPAKAPAAGHDILRDYGPDAPKRG
jgi:hypothetical protein